MVTTAQLSAIVLAAIAFLLCPTTVALSEPSHNEESAGEVRQILGEPPIEQIVRAGGFGVIRLLIGENIYTRQAIGIRIDFRDGIGHLVVKRERPLSTGVVDVAGSREVLDGELIPLLREIERINFWKLPIEEDLMAQWREKHSSPPPVASKYDPGEPISIVCMDGSTFELDVAMGEKYRAVYRHCGGQDIEPVVARIHRLADQILK